MQEYKPVKLRKATYNRLNIKRCKVTRTKKESFSDCIDRLILGEINDNKKR